MPTSADSAAMSAGRLGAFNPNGAEEGEGVGREAGERSPNLDRDAAVDVQAEGFQARQVVGLVGEQLQRA